MIAPQTRSLRSLLLRNKKDSYQESIDYFSRYLGTREVTAEILEEYPRELQAAGYAPATISLRVKAVKARIKELLPYIENAKTAHAITLTLDKMKTPGSRSPIIDPQTLPTYEQIIELSQAAGSQYSHWILFLYETGLRISEACSLKLSQIKEFPEFYLATIIGKGQHQGEVTISKWLYEEIRGRFEGSTYLFERSNGLPYSRHAVQKAINRAGSTMGYNWTPHTLRHARATHLYSKYHDIKAVQKLLRHTDAATTIRMYVHTSFTHAEIGLSPPQF
jgi:integrase/recombinase XerD